MSIRIISAIDKFKGTLSSEQASKILRNVTNKFINNSDPINISFDNINVSDGGEGFINALSKPLNLNIKTMEAMGPLGEKRNIIYGFNEKKRIAVIEIAQIIGLELIPNVKRNPNNTSSYGVGQVLKYILEKLNKYNKEISSSKGINEKLKNKIIIGLGGSGTMDGGFGALSALGLKYSSLEKNENILDNNNDFKNHTNSKNNNDIVIPTANSLNFLTNVDWNSFTNNYNETDLIFACDIDNPLLGKTGAVYTFARQKFSNPDIPSNELDKLEKGMVKWSKFLNKATEKSINTPGAGAAGGLTAGLIAWAKMVNMNYSVEPGANLVLKATDLEQMMSGNYLKKFIFTGEGSFDYQTRNHGKVVSYVHNFAKECNIPCIVICGKSDSTLEQQEQDRKNGLFVYSLTSEYGSKESMENTAQCFESILKDRILPEILK